MNLKNILTEREFVVIDPRGNARPVGMKMQGAQYVKRMGGPKKGYHLVLAKNAMKARRAIEKNGGNSIMTSKNHQTGTDRIFEAVEKIKGIENIKYVINLQGDEPLINPEDKLVPPFATGNVPVTLLVKFTAWLSPSLVSAII